MKKKIFGAFALAALAVAGFAAAGGNASDLSDAQLANIEALSQIETTEPVFCYKTITEAYGSNIRYCATCTYLPGTFVNNSETGFCVPRPQQ